MYTHNKMRMWFNEKLSDLIKKLKTICKIQLSDLHVDILLMPVYMRLGEVATVTSVPTLTGVMKNHLSCI